MCNSKNPGNHNRSFFPSVLNHSRRWSSVAPVATDEKRPSLGSCPHTGLTGGAKPPRLTGLYKGQQKKQRKRSSPMTGDAT